MSDTPHDPETGEITISAPTPPATRDIMVPLASRDCAQVCNALATAQGQFQAPLRSKKAKVQGTSKGGNAYSYEYAYAPLEACIEAVQKPLAEASISRQQYIVWRGNMSFIRTILWHASGQWLAADYPIIQDKDGMAGFAGAVTYAKRQGLCLITGLSPEDDNDAHVDERPVQQPRRPAAAPKVAPKAAETAPANEFARTWEAQIRQSSDKLETLRKAFNEAFTMPDLEALCEIPGARKAPGFQDMLEGALDRLRRADGDAGEWMPAEKAGNVFAG